MTSAAVTFAASSRPLKHLLQNKNSIEKGKGVLFIKVRDTRSGYILQTNK